MREFVPAKSVYTQWTTGYPYLLPDSRKTLVSGGRRRLRSLVMVCTEISIYWNNPVFQFRTAEGATPAAAPGVPAGDILYAHQAPRFEGTYGTGEGLVVDCIEMPGKGIVFPDGIHLWTTSDFSFGFANPISGYTLTIVYT